MKPLTILRYIRNLPLVLKKLAVLHRHGVFFDEANPAQLNTSLRARRIYKRGHGYLRSLVQGGCFDADGNPIPWYTYSAIEQLSKWDFSQCDVLEYGCGNSTLWWGERARSVVSIESSPDWHDRVQSRLPRNCTLILSKTSAGDATAAELDAYCQVASELGQFDVIVIDGVNLTGIRRRCMEVSLPHLRAGGLMIIDNSDWLPETCRQLREKGFMEIDFSGLGPLNDAAETTSLFFKSDLRIVPSNSIHPGPCIGGQNRTHD